jgi:exodeoxyribonuclease VII large subunit
LPRAHARRERELAALAGRLEALSPLAVLERGYSVARRDPSGELVRDGATLALGETLRLRFARGGCRAEVRESWGGAGGALHEDGSTPRS